jgi:hypothetical protein
MGAVKRELAARLPIASLGGIIAALIAIAAMIVISAALAVHDTDHFELEGDIEDAPAGGPDWETMFDANGNVVDLGDGIAAAFLMDDVTDGGDPDDTVFTAGGTKNEGQPETDWQWGSQSVPAKDDLSNVYAYGTLDDDGHLILYAGLERIASNGDSHVDLEFNRAAIGLDEAPPCDDEPCAFTGFKTVGDILVAMDFTNGGDFGSLTVYEWDGSDYVPVAGAAINGQGCNAAGDFPEDVICGFNNVDAIDGGPWPNFDSQADEIDELDANAFTEFGIDLNAILGGAPCITSFMAHTRTSQSITAELKDFAEPTPLPLCGIIWEKQDGEGNPLAGATFSVCRTHDGQGTDIVDECVSITDNEPPDANPNGGEFDYAVTVPGTYEVCETEAPDGYLLDPDCQTIVVEGPGVYLLEAAFVNTTPTPSPSPTPEPTPSPTPELTPSPTPEPTPSPTPSPTAEATASPTPEPTPTQTPEPTPTQTPEATSSPTPEPTPSPTPEPTPSPTLEPTPSPTLEPTPSPTFEPTPSPTPEPTPSPTAEPTPTPTPPPSPAASPTPSLSPASTPTPTPTPTPAAETATPSPSPAALAQALPPTGDGPLPGGRSLLLLAVLGGASFALGVLTLTVAARKRGTHDAR